MTGFDSKNLKFLKPVGTVRVFVEDEDGQIDDCTGVHDGRDWPRFAGKIAHGSRGRWISTEARRRFERHYFYVNGERAMFIAARRAGDLGSEQRPGYQLNKQTVEIGAGETKIVRRPVAAVANSVETGRTLEQRGFARAHELRRHVSK